MSCGVGLRHGLDLAWLWRRLAAVAPIQPPAWEKLSYASGASSTKKKKKLRQAQNTQMKTKGAKITGEFFIFCLFLSFFLVKTV